MDTQQKTAAEYIENQLAEDIAADRISRKEYMDSVTDNENTKVQKQAALAAACDRNTV